MTQSFDRYNDGSQNPPRLQIQHSLWSLLKLPMNSPEEWTLPEKCERVKEAGFAGIECWLDEHDEQKHKDALNAAGLRLTLGHHPYSLEDVQRAIAQTIRLKADFLFAQPLHPYVPLSEAVPFLREARKIAHDHGVTLFIETHRNNIPESLNQALELIERMPEIRFTGDFSHFVVIGEFYGWEGEGAIEKMRPVLERTSHLHGRISNGEQVQVDVGDGTSAAARFFVQIWTETMRAWKREARPGDVLPFASELGPPQYAITLPDGREFSDRWEQSLVMKKLAEEAWALADKE